MSDKTISVHLLPVLTTPEHLAGKAVVVIDVLRATTTIIHALAAGATMVVPCQEIAEAKEKRQSAGEGLLGGERGGVRIEGFDCGNSPVEYTRERVAGKPVFFTTTNGTKAMLRCRLAKKILMGAFVNLSAVCHELAEEQAVEIVCAGTDGEVTREDVLVAGAIADELCKDSGSAWKLNDQADIAMDAWRLLVRNLSERGPLSQAMRESRGGRNLIDLGQQDDIDVAAQIDKFTIAPQLDVKHWWIKA